LLLEGLGYSLFKDFVERSLDKLEPFKEFYEKCLMGTPFVVYMSTGILYSIIATATTFSLFLYLHVMVMHLDILVSLAASTILAIIALLCSAAAVLYYPVYKARYRGGIIDVALLHTLSYMASVAAAGAPPERVIEVAAAAEECREVEKELKKILLDVELMGYDTLTALDRASRRTPSKNFSLFLDGLKSTIATRGAVWEYLMFFFERLVSERMAYLKQILSSIAMIAEVYISLMVAFPVILVIMLSIMSTLGGKIMGFDPILIMVAFITILLPMMGAAILVVLDALLSKV